MPITVTIEDYGDEDVIVVCIDGKEIGAYCIVDNAEAEKESMQKFVDAIAAYARAGGCGCDPGNPYMDAKVCDRHRKEQGNVR